MEKKIITISREFGSGGRTIGRQVAERLGIPWKPALPPSLSKKMASTPPARAAFPTLSPARVFPAL